MHPSSVPVELTFPLLDSRSLQLIVLPTEQCNLRCVYCYEDFSIGAMAPEVADGICNLISARSADLDRLAIEWFGGEPLLAMGVIRKISGAALEAAASRGVAYRAGMTTNGVALSFDRANEIVNLGVKSVKITLDGPAHMHDSLRITRSGRGTFARIMSNILRIHASTLPIGLTIRVHFRPSTVTEVATFLEGLSRRLREDQRITYEIQPVRRLGGRNDDNIEAYASDDSRLATDLMALCGCVPQDSLTRIQKPYICYAAAPNSFVIRANGRVAKCTVALSDERNDVGELRPDGTLRIDVQRFGGWIRGVGTLDLEDLSCPLTRLSAEAVRTSH